MKGFNLLYCFIVLRKSNKAYVRIPGKASNVKCRVNIHFTEYNKKNSVVH